MLGFVVPVWLASGLADWYQHRRTDIEHTAGTKESTLHLLMLAEAGIPSLIALFLEINAGVLLTAYAALLAHDVTALWDVTCADGRRRVTPIEQHIHSFLEVAPVMAVTFPRVQYWDQARALVGVGSDRPDFLFRPKARPLSPTYTAGLLAAIGAFGVLPYAEESCAAGAPSEPGQLHPPHCE